MAINMLPPLQVEVSAANLLAYADASGDRNAIHLNADYAKTLGLPGLVVQGMLNMGLIGRALEPLFLQGYALEEWSARFKNFVQPGQALTITGEITAQERDAMTVNLRLASPEHPTAVTAKARLRKIPTGPVQSGTSASS